MEPEKTITPEAAVEELTRIANHIKGSGARRNAREAELNDVMRRSPIDMLENAEAVSEDAARLQTQLSLLDRALIGAKKRCMELYPIIDDDIVRMKGDISRLQAEQLTAVKEFAAGLLSDIFPDKLIPHLALKSTVVGEQIAFQNANSPGISGVRMVLGGPRPVRPVPATDNNPGAVANSWRRAKERLEATRARSEEIREKYVGTRR